MKHGQDRHCVHANLIDDQIGKRGQRQLPRIRQPTNAPYLGKVDKAELLAGQRAPWLDGDIDDGLDPE